MKILKSVDSGVLYALIGKQFTVRNNPGILEITPKESLTSEEQTKLDLIVSSIIGYQLDDVRELAAIEDMYDNNNIIPVTQRNVDGSPIE